MFPTTILRRLMVLCFLCGCLIILSTGWGQRVLAATCEACDENLYNCDVSCSTQHYICIEEGFSTAECDFNEYWCRRACKQDADSCWDSCTLRDPATGQDTGSHTSACGYGRSACELACNNA